MLKLKSLWKSFLAAIAIFLILICAALVNSEKCKNGEAILPDGSTRRIEVAQTPSQRIKGLSGRTDLGLINGMLFIFDSNDIHTFWMKNTYIPLDVIWMEGNTVVEIASLSPQNGDQIPIHRPIHKADKVLELYSGIADMTNVKVGSTIKFNLCRQYRF